MSTLHMQIPADHMLSRAPQPKPDNNPQVKAGEWCPLIPHQNQNLP